MKAKMKTIKWLLLVLGLGLFALPVILHAQSTASDSIVQVTAENDGLPLIAREDLPLTGTYWLITSNGFSLPMPCAPLDQSLPIYAISDTVFLADGTKGMTALNLHRAGYGTVADVLAAQANAVENLVSQNEAMQMRPMMRSMSLDSSSPIDGLSLGSFTNDAANYTWDTNQLWLEITNVTTDTTFANLHNATNQVYAIWSTTDLATPLNQWQVATELWPVDTNCQPFTVQSFAAQNLFLRAEDWTDIDSDGDGIPDWWIFKFYGDLSETATNLDSQGNTLGYDYANQLDPNLISFTVRLGNQNFNTTNATGNYLVLSGTPSYSAVLVNDTNLADAIWQPYDGSISMNLGSTDGIYQVQFGLKGRAADSLATWIGTAVTLTRTPPQIVLTSPTNGIVAQPWLQLQGYATLPLEKVTYDFNGQTNRLGFITDSYLDTNTLAYTTNWFQCYDLRLNEGSNAITLHLTDPAGNTSTTNFNVTLDYATATNPVVKLTWPQDDMKLCGTNFTVRGWTEDAAAQVSATVTDSNGDTNTVAGMVERTGVLWAENLPLNSGTNFISLVISNSAGLASVTNFTVIKSDLTFALTGIEGSLWQPWVNVSGIISDTNAPVWVNGVSGTNNGDGTWSAKKVPVSDSGVASFDFSTIPPGEADPGGNLNQIKPDETRLESGDWTTVTHANLDDGVGGALEYAKNFWHWTQKTGGLQKDYFKAYHAANTNYSTDTDTSGLEPDRTIPVENVDQYSTINTGGTNYNVYDPAIDDGSGWAHEVPQDEGALNYNNPVYPDFWWQESGGTKVTFYTGGKIGAGTESFYEASGSVTDKMVTVSGAILYSNIPSQDVTVSGFGENLDASSEAWAVLPNPPKVEVTLKAKVPRRWMTVAGKRHSPVSQVEIPARDDSNPSRLKLGVAEEADLYFKPGLPGNAKWKTSAGGFLTDEASGVWFTAPSNASPNTVVSATYKGQTCKFPPFNVVEPHGYEAIITGTNHYTPGLLGAGMTNVLYVLPTDVCFSKVVLAELQCYNTNITGYYTNISLGTPIVGFARLSDDNSEKDKVSSGTVNPTFPIYPGGFDVYVTNYWYVVGSSSSNFFGVLPGSVRLDSNGNVSVSKNGMTITRSINDVSY